MKTPKRPASKYKMQDARLNPVLAKISNYWTELTTVFRKYRGDCGSCVLGAGFTFRYAGEWYFMHQPNVTQGSITWENFKETVTYYLREVGAEEIQYEWGNMD